MVIIEGRNEVEEECLWDDKDKWKIWGLACTKVICSFEMH